MTKQTIPNSIPRGARAAVTGLSPWQGGGAMSQIRQSGGRVATEFHRSKKAADAHVRAVLGIKDRVSCA